MPPSGTPPEESGLREPGFPIVGIGASAGGLEACNQLFRELPAEPGMAFVLVQHLDPAHESALPELIGRTSRIRVHQAKDGTQVEPNHLYVIPPNTDLTIVRGRLQLVPREKVHGQYMPIDKFFRSLAQDQGSRAIGVILSGTASDGTLGIEAIKAEGGIIFAQDEQSAKYPGMPRSAIATGCVDLILSPDGIAKELTRIGRHPYVAQPKALLTPEPLPAAGESLTKIFQMLRVATGVDFTYYKSTTIHRRIQRRMAVNRVDSLDDYVRHLRQTPAEVQKLYYELLVTVTSFFRDPEAFETLKQHAFPSLMKQRAQEEPLRIWVPGCSTGEEAYSLAMCLLECLGDYASSTPIQIFATDVSEVALDKARAGLFVQNIALDVSPERLRRFFVKVEHGYQISKAIRDLCIFAKQDLAKDPPFSKLDLVSCRNVLIYFGPLLHKKIIPVFHYALKPDGFLLLGSSETIAPFGELFEPVDKKHKLYSKHATATRPPIDFAAGRYLLEEPRTAEPPKRPDEETWSDADVQREADRIVLGQYAPAGVLVNAGLEIMQFRGDTSAYLTPAPGRASFNLFKMAREGLLAEMRTAISQAKKKGTTVIKEGVSVKSRGELNEVNVKVVPVKVPLSAEPYLLVLFEKVANGSRRRPGRAPETAVTQKDVDRRIPQLEQELLATKEYLQATIEEQEATNEELKSANEEILSSNEELQTTNEELQTAKEELQSTNEELITVNEELQNRNAELLQVNDDLSNLLTSVNLPIVMLGSDLRVRRFTPPAAKVLGLVPADVGRPIRDVRTHLQLADLEQMVTQVVDTVTAVDQEVQDREGHWYSLRIRPYRTQDHKIDGAVLTLIDIDALKGSLEDLRQAAEEIEDLYNHAPCGYHSLDKDGTFIRINDTELQWLEYSREEILDRKKLPDLLTPESAKTFEENFLPLLERGWPHNLELEFVRKDDTRMPALVNAIALKDADGHYVMSSATVFDITERKQEEQHRILANRELEMLLQVISHDLKEPLRAIENFLGMVHDRYATRLDDSGRELVQRTVKATARMRLLLDDVLALSVARRMVRPTEEVEGEALVREALERLKGTIEKTGAKARVAPGLPQLLVDRTWATQAIYNLLSNALKFTREGEAPDVEIAPYQPTRNDPRGAGIVVGDRGPGVGPEDAERIFELFQRGVGREVEGTGAGLAIVREVARRHGGHAWVRQREGGGSEFIITFGAEKPSEVTP